MDESETRTDFERAVAATLASEPEATGDACPTSETIIALAERTLPEREATPLMAHVALCARCRREFAETVELVGLAREVRTLEARPERREPASFWQRWRLPAIGFSLGTAACAGLGLALLLPAQRERERLALSLRARDAALARAGTELTALRQRRASDRDRLAATVRSQNQRIARLELSQAALAETTLPRPTWSVPRDEGSVRGVGAPTEETPIALVSPVETAVESARPRLVCRALPGAVDYRAQLERADTEGDAPALRPVGPTRWEPVGALEPGIYRWAVTARRGDIEVRSVTARFAVLNPAQRQELAAARKRYARNPLALAAVTARLGLQEETARQLEETLRTDRQNTTARRWRDALQQRTHGHE